MIDELLDSLVVERLPSQEMLNATLAELCHGAVEVEPILHAFKASAQLRVGVRELLDLQEIPATAAALTGIAEAVLRTVVGREEAKLAERLGEPLSSEEATVGQRAGAVVLGMGKFGGRELNYASDIDVVFLYDHEGSSFSSRRSSRSAEGASNAQFFSQVALRTMKVFNAFTPHGRLYEMDSRLRPSGRSGPAAISLEEFARYFAPDGPAAIWERQALVKARVVVGGQAAAARAKQIVEAAAYGRVWTAADIEEIRRMRLRMEQGAKASNLKRGPGGVVDIEFIVQMLQVIHGGREPAVRSPETLAGLKALAAAGHLPEALADFLAQAYRKLRTIESRLRLLDAVARHDFPESYTEQRRLAHLLGYEQPDLLADDVQQLTARIRREFTAVCAQTIKTLG